MLPKIKGFKIAEKIYSGRLTSIYRGTRDSDNKSVILKVLNDEFPSRLQLAKLKHEFDIGTSLAGIKGVISYLDLITEGSQSSVITEDFGGISLRQILDESNLPFTDVLQIGAELGKILGDIHSKGVIHKDLNPNNILINRSTGEIKIIDFEISTYLKHEKQLLQAPDHLEGTLAYISPEQTGRMNRLVDYRTDLYSLGVTLYEMIAGQLPFVSSDNMELVHSHIARVAEPLVQRDNKIPLAISEIVERLMSKAAEKRYKTGYGLKADIEACIKILKSGDTTQKFIIGQNDSSGIFLIPAKLYGRESDLVKLNETFERVRKGSFEMLLVTGAPGIGKSSLINEIHQPITAARGFFISGKFDQFKRNIPYAALILAFQDLIRQLLTESDESLASWKKKLEDALGQNAAVITSVIPALENIMGPQPVVPDLGQQESQNRFLFLFQKLVSVFASAEHPLVLFLDDCQWADSPSLVLLENILKNSDTTHLLLIAAYRDNEVTSGHPLQLTLDRINSSGISQGEIVISPLKSEDVIALVAETLYGEESGHTEKSDIVELAEIIFRKTNGNPFFVNQLLKALYDESLVTYDFERKAWKWSLDAIKDLGNSSNVLEFMVASISKLPEETQNLLKLAACIGNQFTLEELITVGGKTQEEINLNIEPALAEELLQPIGNDYKFIGEIGQLDNSKLSSLQSETKGSEILRISYRFVHDRIQQAAYSMLSEDESQKLHYNVGQLILSNTSEENLDEKIFEITSHLNKGLNLIVSQNERIELSKLNLRAATKARESIAYEPALQHTIIGMDLLQSIKDESSNQKLSFDLHLERAQCEHLTGNDDIADKFYKQALELVPSRLEKTQAFENMIHFYTNTGRFKEAYETGRRALKLFNVNIPPAFIPPLFIGTLIKTKWKLKGKQITDLINMPVCEDPDIIKSMMLLAAILKSAYQIKPQLCIHNAMIAINLTLTHGAIPDATIAYLVYGAIFVGSVLGNHKDGHSFGKLALAMVDKFNHLKQKAEVNFVYGYFANSWTFSAKNTEDYYRIAYDTGLQTGDLFHVACASCTLMESNLIRGISLEEIDSASEKLLSFMRQINNRESAGAIEAVRGTIRNLQGKTDDHRSFGSGDFKEPDYIEEIKAYTSLHFSHFYFINKMQTLYLWGLIDDAVKVAKESSQYLQYSVGMLHTTEHFFYQGLIASASYSMSGNRSQLRLLKKCIKKFKSWQAENPENFSHKYLLLSAELARVTGKHWEATGLYARAIQQAKESQYIQNAAIANELAGRFHLAQKNEDFARMHIKAALGAYEAWGAKAKFLELQKEFSNTDIETVSRKSGTTTHSTIKSTIVTNLNSSSQSLDLNTVLKSARSISAEIKFDQLLKVFLELIMENAGAQRGIYVSFEEGQFFAKAQGKLSESGVIVEMMTDTQMDQSQFLPLSVVQYVQRTRESVVIENATLDKMFGGDPYISKHKVKSALCTPILRQGKLVALIYVENNLSEGTFTPARLEMINLLSSQASISIENARLYTNMSELNIAYQRFVPEEFLRFLSRKSIVDVQLGDQIRKEMSVLFSDIRSFTVLSEKMTPEENFNFINSYLKRMGPSIRENNGFIDKYIGDAIMALFPRNADDAIKASIQMMEGIKLYNIHRDTQGFVPISIGVGIHTGELMLGTVGEDKRMDTTVISDAVNLSSRLESMTKHYGVGIIVSEDTLKKTQDRNKYKTRLLDNVIVKGKTLPVIVYEVFDYYPEDILNEKLSTKEDFEKGVTFFYEGNFQEAKGLFEKVLTIAKEDKAAKLFLERVDHLMKNLDQWKGASVLTEK
jgi:predicted ATPase/class 3 adenylate cyclase